MKLSACISSGMTRIFTLTVLIALTTSLYAQEKIKFYSKEKIKKENGLLGVKRADTWTIPAKYDKIEASGWDHLICYRGETIDVYDAGYNQKLIVSDLTPEQFELFKRYSSNPNIPLIKEQKWANAVDKLTPAQEQVFKNAKTDNIPFIKNGKWGFAGKYHYVGPRFDSLFAICSEDMQGTINKLDCSEVVGIMLNGKMGVAANDGKVIALHKDYIGFRYRFTGVINGRFEVICMHKSGVEVIYDRYSDSHNKFIETKNSTGLKGYVSEGNFVAPKYTEIRKSSLPVADYECVLPDGTVEYIKGETMIPSQYVNEHKQKTAKEEQIRKLAKESGLTVELRTKNHSMYIYPGWSGIFRNPEAASMNLRSQYGNKKPSEVFNEGPDGWIKTESHIYSLNLMFSESESSTLEKEKEEFIGLAKIRTGWAKEKIKPVEERITLPDGRKGLLLFYVCPDTKGMVGGNYFNCHLYVESEKNKSNISCYKIFIEGGNPDLPPNDAIAWKDYFKKVLLTVSEN